MKSTRICIDSCSWIGGLSGADPSARRILSGELIELRIEIPRLIAMEVTRNLHSPEQLRSFFRCFAPGAFGMISDVPAPKELLGKYVHLGLREKGDARIAAFVEAMAIPYLISTNRHFLRELRAAAFQVLTPSEFLSQWESLAS